jgi:hypothetical protein
MSIEKGKENAVSNDAQNLRPKPLDLIKLVSEQKSGGTEVYDKNGKMVLTARERLEVLVSAKVGEELIGRDEYDSGLGFREHLGYGQTNITIEGIQE